MDQSEEIRKVAVQLLGSIDYLKDGCPEDRTTLDQRIALAEGFMYIRCKSKKPDDSLLPQGLPEAFDFQRTLLDVEKKFPKTSDSQSQSHREVVFQVWLARNICSLANIIVNKLTESGPMGFDDDDADVQFLGILQFGKELASEKELGDWSKELFDEASKRDNNKRVSDDQLEAVLAVFKKHTWADFSHEGETMEDDVSSYFTIIDKTDGSIHTYDASSIANMSDKDAFTAMEMFVQDWSKRQSARSEASLVPPEMLPETSVKSDVT
jgi:hypothetical protein